MQDLDLYLATDLQPKQTGLPFVVWVSMVEGVVPERDLRDDEQALFATWVERNREAVKRYAAGEYDSADLIEAVH